jgi:hypothetical protein
MDLFGDMTDLDQGPVSTGPGRATVPVQCFLMSRREGLSLGGLDLLGISDDGGKKVESVGVVGGSSSEFGFVTFQLSAVLA